MSSLRLYCISMLPVLAAIVIFGGCYSFTGSSVPPHLKTVAVPLFEDQSGSGEPNVRESLTSLVIDQFNRDNSLHVAERGNADSEIDGVITAIPDAPLDVSGNTTVTKRRITVNVSATFQDLKLKKKVFERTYSEWGDYDATGSLTDRQNAITTALGKLAEDIVLDTVSGW